MSEFASSRGWRDGRDLKLALSPNPLPALPYSIRVVRPPRELMNQNKPPSSTPTPSRTTHPSATKRRACANRRQSPGTLAPPFITCIFGGSEKGRSSAMGLRRFLASLAVAGDGKQREGGKIKRKKEIEGRKPETGRPAKGSL